LSIQDSARKWAAIQRTPPSASPIRSNGTDHSETRLLRPSQVSIRARAPRRSTLRSGVPELLASQQRYSRPSALPVGNAALEKNVDGGEGGDLVDGAVVENGTDGGVDTPVGTDGGGAIAAAAGSGGGGGGGAIAAAAGSAAAKTAGVDSFTVTWADRSTPTEPGLRLDYSAKFTNDGTHDPALAEFRQNVMTKLTVTAGPNKGKTADTSPMHDDHYSRADDTAGHGLADQDFVSNDNPGAPGLDKDDVVDYAFTAEDMIIDTSQGNKVIARRGPHTATVKGKHPRTAAGVPVTLS
jgi:hypothetical protein